jgi:Uma2 family endonuclease
VPSAVRRSDHPFPGLEPSVVRGYLEAPPGTVAQVIDGGLSLLPRPRPQHARAAGKLGAQLDAPFDGPSAGGSPGGWLFLPEPELHLGSGPDIVVPDLAGWRRERLPDDFFADDAPAFVSLAPDWVCEVLSPSTERLDRGAKLRLYRRERVGHVWLVSPAARTLEVFRLSGDLFSHVDTFEGDAVVRAEPFAAAPLRLGALWSR